MVFVGRVRRRGLKGKRIKDLAIREARGHGAAEVIAGVEHQPAALHGENLKRQVTELRLIGGAYTLQEVFIIER